MVAQLLVRTGGNPLDDLTQRERDVLALMAEGRSNTEIGATLVITESAVSKHINSIFAKLDLSRATSATGGCSRCCATSEKARSRQRPNRYVTIARLSSLTSLFALDLPA